MVCGWWVGLGTGCVRYEARPLDLVGYDRQWAERALPSGDLLGGGGQDASASGEGAWGRRQVLAMTLLGDPELRRARREVGVARATAEHARRWADPELGLELLNNLDAEGDRWLGGVSLGFTLPLSGRLEVAAAAADAGLVQARAEVAAAERQRVRAASEAWASWSAACRLAEATRGYLEEVSPLVEQARRLVEAGEMPPTEARLLQLEVVRRRLELARLEARVRREGLALTAGMGIRPGRSPELRASLEAEEPGWDRGVLDETGETQLDGWMEDGAARWRGVPGVVAASAAYEVAERELEREVRKQVPDLTVGPVWEREEGQSRIGVGLGLPIPWWNRNLAGIAEARARREVARAAAEGAWQSAAAEEAEAWARWSAAEALRRQTREELAGLAEAQIREARQLLEIGEADVLLLHDALAGVIEVRRAVIEADAEWAAAVWDLEILLREDLGLGRGEPGGEGPGVSAAGGIEASGEGTEATDRPAGSGGVGGSGSGAKETKGATR